MHGALQLYFTLLINNWHLGVPESLGGAESLESELWGAVERQPAEREAHAQPPERVPRARVRVKTADNNTIICIYAHAGRSIFLQWRNKMPSR